MSPRAEEPERCGRHDRFTIPLDHPSALNFYLHDLLVPHSRRELVAAAAMRTSSLARRAAVKALGIDTVEPLAERDPARDASLRKIFSRLREEGLIPEGEPSLIILDDYGRSERGKEVAFVFGPRDGLPRLVMKSSACPGHVATLAREHATLRSVRERMDENLRQTIPEPLSVVEDGARTSFAERYFPGPSMYLEMRSSFAPRRLVERHFALARDWLVAFQRATRTGEARFGECPPDLSMVGSLTEYGRVGSLSAPEQAFIAGIVRKAGELEDELLPVVACQGDFWARNLILKPAGLSVLDWEEYSERGSPFFDLFLFTATYGLSYPWKLGRWAEPVAAFRASFLERGWMAQIVRRHLLDHCAAAGISPKLLEVCFPAFLAQRAVEEISGPVSGSDRRDTPDAQRGDGVQQGLSAKGQMWRRLFQEYARKAEYACFG